MIKPDFKPANSLNKFLDENEIRMKRWIDPSNVEAGIKSFIDYPVASDNKFIDYHYCVVKNILESHMDEAGEIHIPHSLMDELSFFNLIYEQLEFIFYNVTDPESIIDNLRSLHLESYERVLLYDSLDYIITTLNGSPFRENPEHTLIYESINLRRCHNLLLDEFGYIIENWQDEDYNLIYIDKSLSTYYKSRYARDLERKLKSSMLEKFNSGKRTFDHRPKVLTERNYKWLVPTTIQHQQEENKPDLTYNQIILIFYCNDEKITPFNMDEIAFDKGYKKRYSGKKLLQKYQNFIRLDKKIRQAGEPGTKELEDKIQLYESVLKYMKTEDAKKKLYFDLNIFYSRKK